MKVIAIVGSSRKGGNTDVLVDKVLEGVEKFDIETEKVYLSDMNFKGCIGCEGCRKTYECVIEDDMQILYKKLDEACGIILGSPTYFYNVSSIMKAFLDRLYIYDVFDDENRSVWISPNEVFGLKYAVTVAVCEQESKDDIGFTSDTMDMTLKSVGYRSVENIKAIHLFKKGEAKKNNELLESCEKAGEKLARTLLLKEKVKSEKSSFNN